MRWYHFVAWFFGGVFLGNFIPHFVNGASGSPFQSPFSHPPGEGLSSSTINVAWGLANLAVAYLLLVRVGKFEIRRGSHVGTAAAGLVLISFMLAHHFGRLHGGAI
jgi:hypothetical protein